MDPDHPLSGTHDVDAERAGLRLASEAPLARGAVVASLASVVLGFVFVPQLLGLALAGLSLAHRERGGRRAAAIAIAISLAMTVVWAVALGLVLKWWASSAAA
jgi:Cu/Ag efflux pump CusA